MTPISPTQESALHKNQPYTKIRFTQESAWQGLKKVGGAAAPPANGASSVRRSDTYWIQIARTVESRSTVLERGGAREGGSHVFVGPLPLPSLLPPPKPFNALQRCAL